MINKSRKQTVGQSLKSGVGALFTTYLSNAIPDTNHNANPTNPNRYSKGNPNPTNPTNPTNPNTRYCCEYDNLNSNPRLIVSHS